MWLLTPTKPHPPTMPGGKFWENTRSSYMYLPCLCHPVPFNTFLNSRRWVWLRSSTHFLMSSSSDRLEADRLTSDPAGSGGLCVVRNGFSLRWGSTETISFGQEAVYDYRKWRAMFVHQRLVLAIHVCTHTYNVEITLAQGRKLILTEMLFRPVHV